MFGNALGNGALFFQRSKLGCIIPFIGIGHEEFTSCLSSHFISKIPHCRNSITPALCFFLPPYEHAEIIFEILYYARLRNLVNPYHLSSCVGLIVVIFVYNVFQVG
jgi:hypothetical protein